MSVECIQFIIANDLLLGLVSRTNRNIPHSNIVQRLNHTIMILRSSNASTTIGTLCTVPSNIYALPSTRPHGYDAGMPPNLIQYVAGIPHPRTEPLPYWALLTHFLWLRTLLTEETVPWKREALLTRINRDEDLVQTGYGPNLQAYNITAYLDDTAFTFPVRVPNST
ncbi:hypothetical protein CVT26_012798 [Gymnopilus dilepis]|uniref:Uncharacterized protein n=1 Tax=Gymnopilus dilepis TaxID=231916 RepID=A0A409Y452_9AGAR|nr:hypothetical protein CVT26_012798 [Gymnopilus dilepis]